MTTLAIPRYVQRQLHAAQWARNGKYPDGLLARAMAEGYNHAAHFRVRQVARFCLPLDAIAGEGDRWRFAFHSSPYVAALYAKWVLAPARDQTGPDPYGRVRIETGTPTTVGDADFHFGSPPATDQEDVPDNFGISTSPLLSGSTLASVPADTDLFGLISAADDGRIVAVSVFEVALDPDTANGYLRQALGVGSPIYDSDRDALADMAHALWKKGAAHSFSWSVDAQTSPRTRTSATPANLIDTSVTSVSAASPGPTLDLQYRSTVRRTTVPIVMKVRAKMASGSGTVLLKNSAGTTLLTITVNSSTEQWWSGTVSLPASAAKYDLQLAGNGTNLLSVYAVSLYPYE